MHSSAKLTLRMDKKLISFAKRYSNQLDKSVSQIVAEYFNLLQHSISEKKQPLMPITRSLVGILKNNKISEKNYHKYLKDKYL